MAADVKKSKLKELEEMFEGTLPVDEPSTYYIDEYHIVEMVLGFTANGYKITLEKCEDQGNYKNPMYQITVYPLKNMSETLDKN